MGDAADDYYDSIMRQQDEAEPRDEDEDTCSHCGATALESFDCALNGCKFGLLADDDAGSATAPADGDNGG